MMRMFGTPITAPVASLAASRVWSVNWSKVCCASFKSSLNLVVLSPSQPPMTSTRSGRRGGSGTEAGGGLAAPSPPF
jgi:hypothetical protein